MNYFRLQIDHIFCHSDSYTDVPLLLSLVDYVGEKRKTFVTELIRIGFASHRVCQEHLL